MLLCPIAHWQRSQKPLATKTHVPAGYIPDQSKFLQFQNYHWQQRRQRVFFAKGAKFMMRYGTKTLTGIVGHKGGNNDRNIRRQRYATYPAPMVAAAPAAAQPVSQLWLLLLSSSSSSHSSEYRFRTCAKPSSKHYSLCALGPSDRLSSADCHSHRQSFFRSCDRCCLVTQTIRRTPIK